MPDLTIELHEACRATFPYQVLWQVGGYYQLLNYEYRIECSCPGFKYRKTCKHAKQVEETRCKWHSAYDEPPTEKYACPRCGLTTLPVGVAV